MASTEPRLVILLDIAIAKAEETGPLFVEDLQRLAAPAPSGQVIEALRELRRLFNDKGFAFWATDHQTAVVARADAALVSVPAEPEPHQFTGNGGADNCQICSRWFDEPETATCKNRLPAVAPDVWKPTHRHVKTGGLYRLETDNAFIEATVTRAAIYSSEKRTTWIRPAHEFHDGRFEAITDQQIGGVS